MSDHEIATAVQRNGIIHVYNKRGFRISSIPSSGQDTLQGYTSGIVSVKTNGFIYNYNSKGHRISTVPAPESGSTQNNQNTTNTGTQTSTVDNKLSAEGLLILLIGFIVVSIVLLPSTIMNYAMHRFVDDSKHGLDSYCSLLDHSWKDPLSWGVSVAVWALVIVFFIRSGGKISLPWRRNPHKIRAERPRRWRRRDL